VGGGFRYLEHITDAYVEAYGNSMAEAFDYSARGLVNLMFDTDNANGEIPIEIKVEGDDISHLLYNWLEKVLLIVLVEGLVMSKFTVSISLKPTYKLEAHSRADSVDLIKHNYKTEVKGITYHAMEVIQKDDLVKIRYIADL
jgi:SHS2 domain-containing protein